MKRAAAIGVLFAVALTGCGGGEASSASKSPSKSPPKPQLVMSKSEIAGLPELTLRARKGQPPRRLVIRDLRKGSGVAMRRGDAVLVGFIGRNYGRPLKTTPATRNKPEKFYFSEIIKGWKLGLPGMRVGGRRELIVPKRLGYTDATIAYVVDLLAVYRGEQ